MRVGICEQDSRRSRSCAVTVAVVLSIAARILSRLH